MVARRACLVSVDAAVSQMSNQFGDKQQLGMTLDDETLTRYKLCPSDGMTGMGAVWC